MAVAAVAITLVLGACTDEPSAHRLPRAGSNLGGLPVVDAGESRRLLDELALHDLHSPYAVRRQVVEDERFIVRLPATNRAELLHTADLARCRYLWFPETRRPRGITVEVLNVDGVEPERAAREVGVVLDRYGDAAMFCAPLTEGAMLVVALDY